MYTTIIAWLKTYTDLYLKAYYDEKQELRWYLRDKTVVTLAKDGDPDEIPAGMAKSTYLFALEFHANKINSTATLTTAFESLLRDLTVLYIYDNPIESGTYTWKITGLSHIPYENENLFGYRLEIDITYWEYLT